MDPDGAITIGLPTTDAFEDGIDVPSVAGWHSSTFRSSILVM